jgi:hypothetical protein
MFIGFAAPAKEADKRRKAVIWNLIGMVVEVCWLAGPGDAL